MLRMESRAKTLLLVVGVLAVGLLNTGCTKSVVLPINLVSGFSISSLAEILAGQPIPEDLEIPTLPLCDSLPDVDSLLDTAMGPFLASWVHLESIELVDTTLTATEGNFNDITYFGMFWQPSPIEGEPQPEVDLGNQASEQGLGSSIVLTPSSTVDFLALLENEIDNTEDECAELGVRIQGAVPTTENMPVIDVQLRIRLTVRFGS